MRKNQKNLKKSLKVYKHDLIDKIKEFDKHSDELLKKEILNLVIKHDIEEEIIRISSHVKNFYSILIIKVWWANY